jgi:hypothetical protein
MLIFIDKKIPEQAKEKLSKYGELIEVFSENITYDAISGHPDIFICNYINLTILAPNAPKIIFNKFNEYKINYLTGLKNVGSKYPDTAIYNALITNNYCIHHIDITDKVVLENNSNKNFIKVKQAYTRCNLIHLKDDVYITSDEGILKTLNNKNFKVFFVDKTQISLDGFKYGFFGGASGVFEDKLFIIGNLKYLKNSHELKNFIQKSNIEIIELYDGKVYDGGGIIFI